MIVAFLGPWWHLSPDSEVHGGLSWLGGKKYRTVTHAYEAFKFRDAGAREEVASIFDAKLARNAARRLRKERGKEVCRWDVLEWEEAKANGNDVSGMRWEKVRLSVMEAILRIKYSWEGRRNLLIQTRSVRLAHGNAEGERYWGVDGGEGKNMYGKLLMKLRDEYLQEKRFPC